MAMRIFPLDHGGAAEEARDKLGAQNDVEIEDRSTWPRFGLKGPGSAAWITGQGITLPRINACMRWDGMQVVRLGENDIAFLAQDRAGDGVVALRAAWQRAQSPRGYDAWRDEGWAWIHVSGSGLDPVLARLCALDLRRDRFADGAVGQTRFGGIDAVVLRHGDAADILFDIAATADMLGQIATAADRETAP